LNLRKVKRRKLRTERRVPDPTTLKDVASPFRAGIGREANNLLIFLGLIVLDVLFMLCEPQAMIDFQLNNPEFRLG
jgi:hypothetical protein